MGRIVQLVLCLCIALAAGGCATVDSAATDVGNVQLRQCPGGSNLPAHLPCPPQPLPPEPDPPLQCPTGTLAAAQDLRCAEPPICPGDPGCPHRPQVHPGDWRGLDYEQIVAMQLPDPVPAGAPRPAPPPGVPGEPDARPTVRSCELGPDGECVRARSMIGRFGNAVYYIAAPAEAKYGRQFAIVVAVDPTRDSAYASTLDRRYPGSVVRRSEGPWDFSMSAELEANPHFEILARPGAAALSVDGTRPVTWAWTLKAVQESEGPTPLVAQLRIHMTGASGQQAMPVGAALEAPLTVAMPFLTWLEGLLNPAKSVYSALALLLGGLWGGVTWLRKRGKPGAGPGVSPAAAGAAPA